jgi:hypothetical protein
MITGGNGTGVVSMDSLGVVRVARLLNFETSPHEYEVQVLAEDSGTPPLSVAGTVHITLLVRESSKLPTSGDVADSFCNPNPAHRPFTTTAPCLYLVCAGRERSSRVCVYQHHNSP